MRPRTCLTAMLLLCSAATAAYSKSNSWLSKTTWTLIDNGTTVRESIDDRGHYIMTSADGKQVDRGTLVLKNGKACHTSAMNGGGEMCWTVPHAPIGQTVTATSAKGRKLQVTRVPYAAAKVSQ